MLYNENLHEEEQHLIQQIAEQTERGKIDWELTEYNPLSFLNEDKIDKNPAVSVSPSPLKRSSADPVTSLMSWRILMCRPVWGTTP